MVLYIIVRIGVYMLALFLTFLFVPGIHIDILRTVTPEELANASPTELAQFEMLRPWIDPLMYFVLALGFWFWNWIFWPVILFFTGRIVLWSFGLLLISANALLFYVVVINGTEPGIWADPPVNVWCAVGGLSMAFWLVVLEGITGLDSPLKTRSRFAAPLLAFPAPALIRRAQLFRRKLAYRPVAGNHHDIPEGYHR